MDCSCQLTGQSYDIVHHTRRVMFSHVPNDQFPSGSGWVWGCILGLHLQHDLSTWHTCAQFTAFGRQHREVKSLAGGPGLVHGEAQLVRALSHHTVPFAPPSRRRSALSRATPCTERHFSGFKRKATTVAVVMFFCLLCQRPPLTYIPLSCHLTPQH